MSLLTPLYVLGALAIGLPILFHLIQRRPKGQMEFSSLLFLEPSPPRLTRRSRLDNILLLLLRALAIILISLAFARPFLRSIAQLGLDVKAESVLVMIDTSASMQRKGLWERVEQEVAIVCDEMGPKDSVALYQFNTMADPLVDFVADTNRAETQLAAIRSVIRNTKPTWQATDLGLALTTGCDALSARDREQRVQKKRLIVISDLQQGSDVNLLNTFEWPEDVYVEFRNLKPTSPGNAFIQVLDPGSEEENGSSELRVRVENTVDSNSEQFYVAWTDDRGQGLGRRYSLHVPAGQNRTLKIHKRSDATRIQLHPNPNDFDNTKFIAQPKSTPRQLWFVGDDSEISHQLAYFLQQIDLNSSHRDVTLVSKRWSDPLAVDSRIVPLIVVRDGLPEAATSILTKYVQSGGRLFVVLATDQNVPLDEMARWQKLLQLDSFQIEQVKSDDYVMLSMIDYQHVIFSPFADPRFNDFTKIRFWRHRRISSNHESPWRILARFEDDAPALVERSIGKGVVWILASGWHTDDSQFALSSKFVPIMTAMFDEGDTLDNSKTSFLIGEEVVPANLIAKRVVTPSGDTISVHENKVIPMEPGIYHLSNDIETRSIAVNLPASESLTRPFDLGELEERGVQVGTGESFEVREEQERQMRDVELESEQSVWRFLLLASLAVLGLETVMAGRQSKIVKNE